MSEGPQNFYHMMLGLPAAVDAPDHYELLGIERFEDDIERIRTAAIDRNRKLLSWQNSEFHRNADHLMSEVVAARAVLLDPQRKAAYDAQLGRLSAAALSGTRAPLPAAPQAVLVPSGETAAPETSAPEPAEEPVPRLPARVRPKKLRQPKRKPASVPSREASLERGKSGRRRWLKGRLLKGGAVLVVGLLLAGGGLFFSGGQSDSSIAVLVSPFSAADAQATQQAWAQSLGKTGPLERNSIGMDLVLVPPGMFMMGSPATEYDASRFEKPQVEVRLTKPLYVSRTEVTQSQWEAVMHTTPWKGKNDIGEDALYPATYVSWDDAQQFCQQLSAREGVTYRLLTEAEWEYACRAGTSTKYHFGDFPSYYEGTEYRTYGWFTADSSTNREQSAHAVGQKGANAFGLHDMHGNVQEWCEDRFGRPLGGGRNPAGPSEGSMAVLRVGRLGGRVHRGGAWSDGANDCRSAHRAASPQTSKRGSLGFRVSTVASNSAPESWHPPATPAD